MQLQMPDSKKPWYERWNEHQRNTWHDIIHCDQGCSNQKDYRSYISSAEPQGQNQRARTQQIHNNKDSKRL